MPARLPHRRLRRRLEDDEVLVARARRGDDAAFAALYDRHAAGLLAFSRSLVGSHEDAEDVVQHVFVAAHRHLTSDPRPLQLKPWLYAAARNRSFDVLRARRDVTDLDDTDAPVADGLAFAAQVEQRADLRDLLADLRRLPEDQRTALVLAELDDLAHDDIAAVLDVRKDKVKALVFQARKALMVARDARAIPCQDIREQLATATGADLRRRELRAHVETCAGCQAFKEDVRHQRVALGLVLPVVPAFALRDAVLDATVGGGAAAAGAALGGAAATGGGAAAVGGGAAAAAGGSAAGGSGLLGALAAGGVTAKAGAIVALAAGGAGGVAAVRAGDEPAQRPAASTSVTAAPVRAQPAPPARAATPAAGAAPAAATTPSRTGTTPRRRAAAARAKARRTAARTRRIERAATRKAGVVTWRGRGAAKAKGRPATAAPAARGTAKPARPTPSPRPVRPTAERPRPARAKTRPSPPAAAPRAKAKAKAKDRARSGSPSPAVPGDPATP